jgi:hypothetical protein
VDIIVSMQIQALLRNWLRWMPGPADFQGSDPDR